MRDEIRYPLTKRLLDKTLSAVLLVLMAPLFGAACAGMGADMVFSRRDRGPWLYRERRISKGRQFELLKFRTLRAEVLGREGAVDGHARLFESDVKNLTWAGRRLLKPWYLDELPQLFNVLRGDLSLVGPRPWPVAMAAEQVAGGLDYRNRIMAGWTGPAQVEKGVIQPAGYTELDLAYVDACRTWSDRRLLVFDLAILWKTLGLTIRGEGLEF